MFEPDEEDDMPKFQQEDDVALLGERIETDAESAKGSIANANPLEEKEPELPLEIEIEERYSVMKEV